MDCLPEYSEFNNYFFCIENKYYTISIDTLKYKINTIQGLFEIPKPIGFDFSILDLKLDKNEILINNDKINIPSIKNTLIYYQFHFFLKTKEQHDNDILIKKLEMLEIENNRLKMEIKNSNSNEICVTIYKSCSNKTERDILKQEYLSILHFLEVFDDTDLKQKNGCWKNNDILYSKVIENLRKKNYSIFKKENDKIFYRK